MTCKTCELEDVLYEDDFVRISHGNAVEGHLNVFPKKHLNSLDALTDEEVARFFFTASFAATVVFESLNVQGTNIIFQGEPDSPHLNAQILPRTFEDNIDVRWEPIQVNPDEFKEIAERIRKADEAVQPGEKAKPLKAPKTLEEEDYRVKHLDRLP